MARSDNNLKAVLQDTANAIRGKTGGSSVIVPRDFADTIGTITKVIYTPEQSADTISKLYSGTLVNAVVPDDVTSLHPYLFYNMTSLVSCDFNNVGTIPEDCCIGCSNLSNITFSINTTRIENYAFKDCSKLTDISIPHTITYVGDSAFINVGNYYNVGTHTFEFVDNVGIETYIGNYAFMQSHLSNFSGIVTNIGNSAFKSCSSLLTVNLKVDNGQIGANAFDSCGNIETFTFDVTSNVALLGNGAFYGLSTNKLNAVISPFDFRNSTFTSLSSNVWKNCKFNGTIYFPATLSTISGNFLTDATGNWTLYFNSVPAVSSSSYLRDDTSSFSVKYCFEYSLLGQAAGATTWTSHTSQMLGYGDGFAQGSTLPQYERNSGVAISWYSDSSLTTPVTTSAGASTVYYCTLGSTRVVWFVNAPTLVDGSVTISDGTNTYASGDPIPVNTSVTVTPSATDPNKNILYLLQVNGTDYTSAGSATVTMTQDLNVVAVYWDGVNLPFLPNLADNSWDMIKLASVSNAVPSSWSVGDTKSLTIDGVTYQARLVDKTGKYQRVSDNSTAYLKFELTACLPTKQAFNANSNNRPAQSPLLTDINSGTIYNTIDSALLSAIEPVKVKVSQGGGSSTENTLIDYEAKFFFQREHDLFSTKSYSVQAEWDAISAQDEYYITNNTDSARIKQVSGTNSAYWQMSPIAGGSSGVCAVNSTGSASGGDSSSSRGVALAFAL